METKKVNTVTQKELDSVIEKHKHWLNKDCEGWEDMRANLHGADLSCTYMVGVDLTGADLSNSNLSHVNMRNTILKYADLSDANMRFAILTGVDLEKANLNGAFLNNADLRGANLDNAELDGSNLNGAFLDHSEKCRLGMILKEPMKGYKKTMEGDIIELEIPRGAIVFSINKTKCRTNRAIITKCEGVKHSMFFHDFEYRMGDEIEEENFNTQYNVECGAGIHFFKTKIEAEKY